MHAGSGINSLMVCSAVLLALQVRQDTQLGN